MFKKGSSLVLYGSLLVVLVVLSSEASLSQAVTCSAVELSPCLPAVSSGSAPTTSCCGKVREQRPCLCGYLKDPNLKQFITTAGAKRIASACGVPFPSC